MYQEGNRKEKVVNFGTRREGEKARGDTQLTTSWHIYSCCLSLLFFFSRVWFFSFFFLVEFLVLKCHRLTTEYGIGAKFDNIIVTIVCKE